MTAKKKKAAPKKARAAKSPKAASAAPADEVPKAPTNSGERADEREGRKTEESGRSEPEAEAKADAESESTPIPPPHASAQERASAAHPRLKHIRERTSAANRVRSLVMIDVQNLVHRLDAQLPAMIDLFSKNRDRETLTGPLRSWLPTATFDLLCELEPAEQRILAAFLEELEALRWYCRYTNDMPNTAQTRLQHFAEQLDISAQKLVRELQTRLPKE